MVEPPSAVRANELRPAGLVDIVTEERRVPAEEERQVRRVVLELLDRGSSTLERRIATAEEVLADADRFLERGCRPRIGQSHVDIDRVTALERFASAGNVAGRIEETEFSDALVENLWNTVAAGQVAQRLALLDPVREGAGAAARTEEQAPRVVELLIVVDDAQTPLVEQERRLELVSPAVERAVHGNRGVPLECEKLQPLGAQGLRRVRRTPVPELAFPLGRERGAKIGAGDHDPPVSARAGPFRPRHIDAAVVVDGHRGEHRRAEGDPARALLEGPSGDLGHDLRGKEAGARSKRLGDHDRVGRGVGGEATPGHVHISVAGVDPDRRALIGRIGITQLDRGAPCLSTIARTRKHDPGERIAALRLPFEDGVGQVDVACVEGLKLSVDLHRARLIAIPGDVDRQPWLVDEGVARAGVHDGRVDVLDRITVRLDVEVRTLLVVEIEEAGDERRRGLAGSPVEHDPAVVEEPVVRCPHDRIRRGLEAPQRRAQVLGLGTLWVSGQERALPPVAEIEALEDPGPRIPRDPAVRKTWKVDGAVVVRPAEQVKPVARRNRAGRLVLALEEWIPARPGGTRHHVDVAAGQLGVRARCEPSQYRRKKQQPEPARNAHSLHLLSGFRRTTDRLCHRRAAQDPPMGIRCPLHPGADLIALAGYPSTRDRDQPVGV